jgi:hypothetical protein
MKTRPSLCRCRRQLSQPARLKCILIALGVLASGGLISAPGQTLRANASDPDPNAPWPEAEKSGRQPQSKAPAKSAVTTPTPAIPAAASPVPAESPAGLGTVATLPALAAPKPTKHQVSISADYFLGQGDVTLPLGFGLVNAGLSGNATVAKPERDSDYIGATVSYSYGQAWFLDLGYAQGETSGNVDVDLGQLFPSSFTIEETIYQAYLRYTPPALRGKRLSAYVRAGVSYVDSELTDQLTIPQQGLYQETVEGTDLLGNVGFGLGYRLYSSGRFRLGLQAEAEGFYGNRSQDITESFPQQGTYFPTVTIDNTLYGGIGRATVRVEYRLGRSGLLRAFLDAGAQMKFTRINYPSAPGFAEDDFDELLWGPYAKLGFSYSF